MSEFNIGDFIHVKIDPSLPPNAIIITQDHERYLPIAFARTKLREAAENFINERDHTMSTTTTEKHHTWTATDENGQEWEYRAQMQTESGDKTGWKFWSQGDFMWVAAVSGAFSVGFLYRRPVRPKFSTLTHPDGYEVRVYWEQTPVLNGHEWEYADDDGKQWYIERSGWFDSGLIYRRKGADQ